MAFGKRFGRCENSPQPFQAGQSLVFRERLLRPLANLTRNRHVRSRSENALRGPISQMPIFGGCVRKLSYPIGIGNRLPTLFAGELIFRLPLDTKVAKYSCSQAHDDSGSRPSS